MQNSEQIHQLQKRNLYASLLNMVIILPIQFVIEGILLDKNAYNSGMSLVGALIAPIVNIVFNVMMIRLHFPEKDHVKMWESVNRYSCAVKVIFWIYTILLPLNFVGMIIISVSCSKNGYNTLYCLH